MSTALGLPVQVYQASLWLPRQLNRLLPMLEWVHQSSPPIKDKQEQLSYGFMIPVTDSEHIMLCPKMERWFASLCQRARQSTNFSAQYLGMVDITLQAITVVFMYVSCLDLQQSALIKRRVMALLLLCRLLATHSASAPFLLAVIQV
jgi:hypothetical protein